MVAIKFSLLVAPLLAAVPAVLGQVIIDPIEPTRVIPTLSPAPTYQSCGGFRIEPKPCPKGYECIDDPRRTGCGMACDMPGICVKPVFCGGFAGLQCPKGQTCYDDPRDDCDPRTGGADCGGLCIYDAYKVRLSGSSGACLNYSLVIDAMKS
ncbi:hypothetical protein AJ80_03354 [Polytolypa hystricis UAMH7299]|uniref:Uncharacterized protein n=1 Tax=Polytolypa hystricis (strain UAMH7299) TaxID=1447883 RepID=A0A2B7YB66_POLH7|nr:hypothetical protein AJ80_03354 [Polytolypa hystricis UAMH7299]